MKKLALIFVFAGLLIFLITPMHNTGSAYVPEECSSTQLDDKVLTDIDCWVPGQIQKRCLQQTNKCCNANSATSCV